MYKKILVAIDDSDTSRCALDEAKHLARTHGARLCITHVADETLMGMQHHRTIPTSVNLDLARQAIVDAGRKLVEDVQQDAAGIDTETLVLEASTQRVSEVIVEAARTWQADLIVVGTHGRRGVQRLILGSVAEQLVRLASVSVLLVRKH